MRVVVTGYGLITAAGRNADECWKALSHSDSGIGPNTIVPLDGVASELAGQIRSLPEPDNPPKDRSIRLGEIALAEALERAGLGQSSPYPASRRALSLGTSMGGSRAGEAFHRTWVTKGLASADPYTLMEYPLHATADSLARTFCLHGPRTVHSNACAAGTVAIGHGYEFLLNGHANLVIAGGVDPLVWLSFAGFSSLGALSALDCAPYTRSDGITLGEGAGFLILEEHDRALARGAKVYAELLGYGLSSDAYHPTAPDPRGRGALAAMRRALEMGGVDAGEVDYVNGHGTGTPANDTVELRTISLLGERIPMSSTKSMVGHTLGAAGAVEAVVSVMTVDKEMIHPTHVPGDEAAQRAARKLAEAGRVDIVSDGARRRKARAVLSNSFAFGGNNAVLLIGSPDSREEADGPRTRRSCEEVAVTAVGTVVGSAANAEGLRDALATGEALYRNRVTLDDGTERPLGLADRAALAEGISPRILRRTDQIGRLSLSAVQQLLAEHPIEQTDLATTGLLFATASGPLETVEAFQRGLLLNGQGSHKLFPNTVMNAAGGHVALAHGLKGPTATMCAGETSGVSALFLAMQLVRQRACDRVIVVAADEVNATLLSGYNGFHRYLSRTVLEPMADTGTVYTEGGIALLVEAIDSDRSATRVVGFGMTGDGPGAGYLGKDPSAWARSFELAMREAGVTAQDLDLVISAATGHAPIDDLERAALTEAGLDGIRVLAPKAVTGETQSCGSLLGLAMTSWIARGLLSESQLVSGRIGSVSGRLALISGYGVGGNYQSMVVRYS